MPGIVSFLLGLMAQGVLAQERKTVVFFGDSLTAGYGLAEESSFPSLIGERLKREGSDWTAVNAGVSGDTTAGALRRLKWVLKAKPSVVFVALGANDGLRGLDMAMTQKNLRAIVRGLKAAGAGVVLAGMQLPANYGPSYRKAFDRVFSDVARSERIPLYPFLLEGVAMRPGLNLPDGIHPNAQGQRIIADKVYEFLKPILQ